MKLNLGCQNDIREGFINIDIVPKKGVYEWNLNKLPLPFNKDSVDYILCSHVLEHLHEPIPFMEELWRICKRGAIIDVFVPHFSGFTAHADLDHKRAGMSYFSFGEIWVNYSLYEKFKVLKRKINFTRVNHTWLNYIFNPIINLCPTLYERFWCYLIPSTEIIFKLEVVK